MELTLIIVFITIITIFAYFIFVDAKNKQEEAQEYERLQESIILTADRNERLRKEQLLLDFFTQNNICRYKIFRFREYKYDGKPYGKPFYEVLDRLHDIKFIVSSTDEELKSQYGVEQFYVSQDYQCIEK